MIRLSICLICLTCAGAMAQTERSAPVGPNTTIPSAAPLPSTGSLPAAGAVGTQTSVGGAATTTQPQQGSVLGTGTGANAPVVGGAVLSGTNQGSVDLVEPGLIHEPVGSAAAAAANRATGATNNLQTGVSGITDVENSSVTAGFIVTNGVVVGTVVTNIIEPSGAANQEIGGAASAVDGSQQNFGQRVLDSLGAQSTQGTTSGLQSSSPVVALVTADGTVILRGTVASEAERQNIEARLQGVTGVTGVQNELQVQGTGIPTTTEAQP